VDRIEDDADIARVGEVDSLVFELIVPETERRLERDVDPILLLEMRSVKDLAAILAEGRSAP
jgi:hypothetical protein